VLEVFSYTFEFMAVLWSHTEYLCSLYSVVSLPLVYVQDQKMTRIYKYIFLKSKCPLFNLHVNFIESGLSNFCKTVVFWVETQCSLVGGYECFGGSLWLHHQGWIFNLWSPFNLKSEGSIFLWNSGTQIPDYMVSHVKRL